MELALIQVHAYRIINLQIFNQLCIVKVSVVYVN